MTPPITHLPKSNIRATKPTYKKRGRPVSTDTVHYPKSFSAPIETVRMLEAMAEHLAIGTDEAPNNSATICLSIVALHKQIFGKDNEDRT